MKIILLLGIVSLLGDITYEGARGVLGPYFAGFGITATVLGIIVGIGEFLGYTLRMVFGYIADKTKGYWLLTFIGYSLIFAIPLLGLSKWWYLSAFLVISERIGKAIRTPARDSIISHISQKIGRGTAFGIHEFFDQIGAIIGPLILSFAFYYSGNYNTGFLFFFIPTTILLAILYYVSKKVPQPQKEEKKTRLNTKKKIPKIFWYYSVFSFFSVIGFVNFAIISYHFKVQNLFSDTMIPILYSIAMGIDAVAALIIGKVYDKTSVKSLIIIPLLTMLLPFTAFSSDKIAIYISILLIGTILGVHETIMKASVADITPIGKRGFLYGFYNTVYGLAWFLGSAIVGFLYSRSLEMIGVFVLVTQILGLIAYFGIIKEYKRYF